MKGPAFVVSPSLYRYPLFIALIVSVIASKGCSPALSITYIFNTTVTQGWQILCFRYHSQLPPRYPQHFSQKSVTAYQNHLVIFASFKCPKLIFSPISTYFFLQKIINSYCLDCFCLSDLQKRSLHSILLPSNCVSFSVLPYKNHHLHPLILYNFLSPPPYNKQPLPLYMHILNALTAYNKHAS